MKKLKELGMCELSLGVESGDDRIRNSIRIAICRMIPLSFNVLFTEQDSIDFDPALFGDEPWPEEVLFDMRNINHLNVIKT